MGRWQRFGYDDRSGLINRIAVLPSQLCDVECVNSMQNGSGNTGFIEGRTAMESTMRPKDCKFGAQCRYRLRFCPFRHPRKVVIEKSTRSHQENYPLNQFRGSWKNPNAILGNNISNGIVRNMSLTSASNMYSVLRRRGGRLRAGQGTANSCDSVVGKPPQRGRGHSNSRCTPIQLGTANHEISTNGTNGEEAMLCGGPLRAVRRSGQRRTPHRPVHTYPHSGGRNGKVNSSTAEWQNTHTHTHTHTHQTQG
jgi:hypothetical protein